MLMAVSDVLQLYRDAWNERDELKRLPILSLILHGNMVLFHSLGRVAGPRPIAHFIGDLHTQLPFDRLEYTTLPQEHEHGQWIRVHWGVWFVGGVTPNAEGLDIMEFDDENKIRQIISFSGRISSGTSSNRQS